MNPIMIIKETWLDRSGYPSIWLYYSETSENGIPVDILHDGEKVGSTKLSDIEKKELLDYLNENTFIIQVGKRGRTFFITPEYELTWMKDYAWKFSSKEDIKNTIKEDRISKVVKSRLELTTGEFYKIVKYSDAKNH